MKKIIPVAVTLTLSVFCSAALAEERPQATPYFGASYGYLDADFGTVKNADADLLLLRLGAEINELLAAEVRLGAGLIEDSVQGAKVKVSQQRAAYVLLNLPLNERFTPYLLGGYSYSELKISGGPNNGTHGEDSFAYGAGVNFNFDEVSSVNVEAMSLLDTDYSDQTLLSLGFKVKF